MINPFNFNNLIGVPKGIRTPVTAVKGRCPRPLDDGDGTFIKQDTGLEASLSALFFHPDVSRCSWRPDLVELGGIEPPTSTMPL